ncbi:N-acetylglucosaminyl deacetylase, LmbE family [Bryocella elongata]|uniref:N-acetylglucosaminyl deacetylase, LmbE family n=1 Tax=Bryocella elongata TaxID=863522 RepID=A0A1H5T4T7_9BACT|nr:PIG-L family deacetylase [Bryocella elongata]SEF57823.1 N-acetylglucosaminyl deacetylase, LmbE family [Bryocella elongata]
MQRLASLAVLATLASAVMLAPAARAQATFADPANLAGERPTVVNGRELPIDLGSQGLQQMLRRLNTRASLLLIVAHPDDEDGGMLTYVSRGLGAHTGILTLNRGEGGQNAMTSDFEDALGLLRTQELLSADRYLGVTQMFGTEVDFGFSKTKEESFAKWGHERVLYDAVRAVRIFRPLVIAAVFVGGVTDGHGQHQVSGEIAQEVFKAAGDPKVFPEMAKEGILPWQPLKVYARVPRAAITDKGLFDYATNQYIPAQFKNYVTGEVSDQPPTTDVIVHEGATDPLLGNYPAKEPFVSYVQFARQGLGLQRSQVGPGMRVPSPGVFDVGYHRYGTVLPPARQKLVEDTFFDGIDTSVRGIGSSSANAPAFLSDGLRQLQALIENATYHFNPETPGNIAPTLADANSHVEALIARVESTETIGAAPRAQILHELKLKHAQLNDALALSLGLTLDAIAPEADLPSATAVKVMVRTQTAAEQEMRVDRTRLITAQGGESMTDEDRRSDRSFVAGHPDMQPITLGARETTVVTRPYFYRDDIEQPVYKLRDASLRNAPATPPAVVAQEMIGYHGMQIELDRVVHAGIQPVEIVPHASVSLSSSGMPVHAQVLPDGDRILHLSMMLHPAAAGMKPKLAAPANWKSSLAMGDAAMPNEVEFQVTAPAMLEHAATLTGEAIDAGGTRYMEGYRAIGYGDLPRTNYFTPATDRVVPVDLKLPPADKRRIGYLPGTGDDVPAALASIGMKPTMLTVADLTPARLAQFDTVVLGVRTYNAHPDLHGAPTHALLEYARNGGNVVVQYQTAEFTAADAPYPLTLGGAAEKVVDETDPVQLLDTTSPLLSTPNRITPADFNGWIEERGHGFLGTWDSHYTALTEVHDPGSEAEHVQPEQPQKGGLVTAPLGKGRWTYLAFAVYRQLPEAVPGAFRLFVNLLNP